MSLSMKIFLLKEQKKFFVIYLITVLKLIYVCAKEKYIKLQSKLPLAELIKFIDKMLNFSNRFCVLLFGVICFEL